MKRIFEIEFPENKDGKIKATDITGNAVYLSDDQIVKGIRFPDGVSLQQADDIISQLKNKGWRKVEVRDMEVIERAYL